MPTLYRKVRPLLIVLIWLCSFSACTAVEPLALPLAHTYKEGVDLKHYWLSEKLDGVRAYWDGERLLSKRGNVYHAPDWFTTGFPNQALDGELWLGRGQFDRLMTIVRDEIPGEGWRDIRYMVFDVPLVDVSFTDRLKQLESLFTTLRSPYIGLVDQSRVAHHSDLMNRLDEVINFGGEGLMLHRGDARYVAGRSNNLLKVKRYQDAEARVIAHLPGKGKYAGMLGALLVESDDKHRFRLGSGFSDQERRQPPSIGAIVTYRYYGKTAKGLPRFASFIRVREP